MSRVTCECALCVANLAIWNGAAMSVLTGVARSAPSASDYDEETLRRSFGGLSRTARREQRRPLMPREPEEWQDEISRCTEGGLRDVC